MIREFMLLEGAAFPEEVAKRVSAEVGGQVPELLVVTGRQILSDELSVRRGQGSDRPFHLAQIAVFDEGTVTAQDTLTQCHVRITRGGDGFIIGVSE